MSLIPKSSVKILEAKAGELVYAESENPFVGSYIETDEGKYFAGSNINSPGPRLKKPNPSILKFGRTKSVKKFNIINKAAYNILLKKETLIPSKTIPTEKDYNKGFVKRYFAQKSNDISQIFEISKKTYDEFGQKYDNFSFIKGSLIWTLEGNVRKANKLELERKAKNFPYIQSLFPILSEFESSDTSQNLFTPGGELYYENGREYTGAYHIHPEKGPMVGAKHVEEAHDTLVWAKDLQSPNELKGLKDINYQDLLKDKKREELNTYRNTPSRETRPRPISDSLGTTQRSTPRTSGGGGGGY